MIHDFRESAPLPGRRTDVLIVGAGAAGITLALAMAARGKSVTVLEAGGGTLEPASQEPYRSVASGLAHRGLHQGRFRALGGTTTQWGGQILELDELDFCSRAWVPGSGWPFPKSVLTPFYAKALRTEGLADALHSDEDVWRAVGQQRPAFPCLEAYASRWCPEPNFARLHAGTLAGPKLHIWLHANATELRLDGDRVTGVRVRTLPAPGAPVREALFHASEYCFALGAIESSRFFLQPRRDGAPLPWNESGLLGRHFQDHIDLDAAVVLPHAPARFHALFDAIFLRGFKYNPKLRLDAATQQAHRILHAGATFYSASSLDATLTTLKQTGRHLLRGRFGEVTPQDALYLLRHSPTLARQTWRYAVRHRAYHPAGAQLRMRVHCEQEPETRSAIMLHPERDALGLFRTQLSWHIGALELRTIRSFLAIAAQSIAAWAELQPLSGLEDDATLTAHCEDSFHHMGGMRMDPSARRGVVDADLKLHGTTNAWVCSSAVYPTSGFSNPTHTLLALAHRLAAHLT